MKNIILFSGFHLLFLFFCLQAQNIPEGFNYQCLVRNSTGDIVPNTQVALKVSVLKNFSTTVYAEDHVLITNQLGMLSTVIGMGVTSFGQFDTLDWASGEFYLNVQVDINFTGTYTDMGTTQLLSVPYALTAKRSLEGIAYQKLSSFNFSTTFRDSIVFSNDSLVVEKSGVYLIALVAEGNGTTYNPTSTPYGDNGVFATLYRGNNPLTDIPLHNYLKDEAASGVYYNLTPRHSSKITTEYLAAGSVLKPAIKIWRYGSGGNYTHDMGYYNFDLTIVKLR